MTTTRKHEADSTVQQYRKKSKGGEDGQNGNLDDVEKRLDEFSKLVVENLSVSQMREILQMNGHDDSGTEGEVITKCQDLLFFGPLDSCPYCNGSLNFDGKTYKCNGFYSEWSSCTFKPKNPPRKDEPTKLPDSVRDSNIGEILSKHENPGQRAPLRPFTGMTISLMGRLSRTHQFWKKEIEKHGGKVSNTVRGVSCLVASPAERERGGSSKLDEAIDEGTRIVREGWLFDSIEKQEPQPLECYDFVSDLVVEGKGIPLDKQDPDESALESLISEVKVYGKRGVHKDTKLHEQDGKILEHDGVIYNCALSLCDIGREINQFCVIQLIELPEKKLNLYCKRGSIGDPSNAEEKLEEWEDVNDAIKEFARLFEELTGNKFEPWEREKKFEKKRLCFFPIDMGEGYDVRHGGLALRQLGIAAAHCNLEARVANLIKVLCSQEIYRYALTEMDLDSPDFPMGMLSEFHLRKGKETLLEFAKQLKSSGGGDKAEAIWSDFSQRWFTLYPSTRPFIMRDCLELADHGAAVFETIRDIVAASHVIGDMSGSTLDDPLSDRYAKLGCTITPLEKEAGDYEMVVKYLEKTYEPVKLGDIEYGISVDNVFAVESSASPSIHEMRDLPNKVLLWCGTRSSNLLRHLQKGFLPNVCHLPAPGYMFGEAIVCSDAAAEAAKYGYTAIDRPEGFLILAVASLGEKVVEVTRIPEEEKLSDGKNGVKCAGRKKTEESEHFLWEDGVKVPCGRLVVSGNEDSAVEYNAYAVYDPKMTSIRFLVSVRYEEKKA